MPPLGVESLPVEAPFLARSRGGIARRFPPSSDRLSTRVEALVILPNQRVDRLVERVGEFPVSQQLALSNASVARVLEQPG